LSDTCNDVEHVRVAVFGSDTALAVGVHYTDINILMIVWGMP